jgi:hypothetical protein
VLLFPRACLRRAVAWTLALALTGVLISLLPVTFPQVNVIWSTITSQADRAQAATDLGLIFLRDDDGGVVQYLVTNESAPSVKRLLSHPLITSVTVVDKKTLTLTERRRVTLAEWLDLRYPGKIQVSRLVRGAGLAPLFLFVLVVSLLLTTEGRRWLVSRLPAASAQSVGVCRVVLAIVLAPVVLRSVAQPTLLLVLLFLFGIGAAARFSWIAFIAVFTAIHWDQLGQHDYSLPVKTMWLLCVVPWGDSLSVDQVVRHIAGRPKPRRVPQLYGLATWIPIFMLGYAYVAAAFAKMDETGPRWITDGCVRYFLVIDGVHAPTSFGRLIASNDSASMLAAAGAVFIEATVIAAALWATPIVTAVAGAGALVLHIGFWVFQGVFWPLWWALLPAFLPWNTIVTRFWPNTVDERLTAGSLTRPVAALLALVLLQQPVASFLKVEYPPLLSNFPMYSDVNWESKDEFARYMDRERQPSPQVRLVPADGSSEEVLADRLRDIGAFDEVAHIAGGAASRGPSDNDRRYLGRVATIYMSRYGSEPPTVNVLTRGWRFDWSVADFVLQPTWDNSGTLELDV